MKKDNRSNKRKYSLEEFQSYAKSKGGECLSKEFVSIHKPLDWVCKNGHQWSSSIRLHEPKPSWCVICSHSEVCGQYHKLNIEACHKLAESFGGECLSSSYQNARTLLRWKCKNNHIFEKSYDTVSTQKAWCSTCNVKRARSEKLVRKLFEKIFKSEFPTKRPPWLKNPSSGYPLELDGYNQNLAIAFEFNGYQHYEEDNRGHRCLKEIQRNDRFKVRTCKEKGVRLIVIPWTTIKKGHLSTLKSFLQKEFLRLGIEEPKGFKRATVSIPEVYKSNDVDCIKALLAKDKFEVYKAERGSGGTIYTLLCPNGHYSRRSGYDIRNRTVSLCKRCLLQTKGYKITPQVTPEK